MKQKCVSGVSGTDEEGVSQTQIQVEVQSSAANTFSTETDPEVSQSEFLFFRFF